MNCTLCMSLWIGFSQPHWFLWRSFICTEWQMSACILPHIWSKMSISSVGWMFPPLLRSVVLLLSLYIFDFMCIWGFFSDVLCLFVACHFSFRFFSHSSLLMVQCTVKIRKTFCIFKPCNHRELKRALILFKQHTYVVRMEVFLENWIIVSLYWISMKSTMIHSLVFVSHKIKITSGTKIDWNGL